MRERDAKKTDKIEIRAVLCLLYFAGIMHSSYLNVSDFWADEIGVEMFRTVMPLKWFDFLLRCLCFDNIHNR